MLRKILTILVIIVLAVAFGCKKQTPVPTSRPAPDANAMETE